MCHTVYTLAKVSLWFHFGASPYLGAIRCNSIFGATPYSVQLHTPLNPVTPSVPAHDVILPLSSSTVVSRSRVLPAADSDANRFEQMTAAARRQTRKSVGVRAYRALLRLEEKRTKRRRRRTQVGMDGLVVLV